MIIREGKKERKREDWDSNSTDRVIDDDFIFATRIHFVMTINWLPRSEIHTSCTYYTFPYYTLYCTVHLIPTIFLVAANGIYDLLHSSPTLLKAYNALTVIYTIFTLSLPWSLFRYMYVRTLMRLNISNPQPIIITSLSLYCLMVNLFSSSVFSYLPHPTGIGW